MFPRPKGPGNPLNLLRARDWGLQFFPMNEEFLVSASHKLVLIKSLPFVHTARRYYRLNDLVRSSDLIVRLASLLVSMLLGKTTKLDRLEEVKVVTRFSLVNQRKDHYKLYYIYYYIHNKNMNWWR